MAGAVAYISRDTDGVLWKKVLEAGLGPLDFRRLDALGDKADIEVALAWEPVPGLLASFPNLKLIVSLGMGVDHLLSDDKLPADVPITRLLAESDILVNVLPLTRETRGILDAKAFAALPKGAYFINMARGGHVVDDALLAALNSTHLSGAVLDVFNQEPLPADHPYWTHPKVHVTPHIAGATNPRTPSPRVIENIQRLPTAGDLMHPIYPNTGY